MSILNFNNCYIKKLTNKLREFDSNYFVRFYSTDLNNVSSENKYLLHPNFVTGFIDGEGSFMVYIRKSSRSRTG